MAKYLTIDNYISAQPDFDYYIWQLQVQMNNFKKFDIENKAIIILSYNPNTGINKNALAFQKQTKAKVLFYPDTRDEIILSYVPSIRPHILKKFYLEHGKILNDKIYLYHDSDILFTRLPKIEFKGNSKKIILSDTISYIGSEYIKSKSSDLLNEMCEIIGIEPKIVINNELNSGGAQYLFSKNTSLNYEFWDKVERDSVLLFHHMQNTKNKHNPSHPIQSWTSDMWAVLWNIWLNGYETVIHKELNFSWATSPISDWEKYTIFHNAGVTPDRNDLFFKGKFSNKTPFFENFEYVSNQFCSCKYVEEIIETRNNLKLKASI